MIIKRKLYSKYDETDEIKRMKDSDILDAKPKKVNKEEQFKRILRKIGHKAAVGTAIGAGLSLLGKNRSWDKTLRNMKWGAGIGAIYGSIQSHGQNKQERDDSDFYNDRLEYAQKHARRRERSDWRNNMTQREGYSY